MRKKQRKYNWRLKLGLSIFVLIVIYMLNFLLNPYSSYWQGLLSYNTLELSFEFALSFLFSWIIIETSILIASVLERYLPWTNSPLLRFFMQTFLIIVSILAFLFIQGKLFILICGEINLTQQEYLETWQFFIASIITSLFVSAVHTSSFLLKRWKLAISEAGNLRVKTMELKEIAMQAELQSLKIQLDPHFMFNNFSTLSELINEDADLATRFLENLSRVYRYMLQNIKRDLISLAEEVAFVKAYYYLIHIRHDDNVQVIFDLDEDSLRLSIPPISLQLLVENAIKHNMATREQPLIITITLHEGKSLKVCNNLQRIPTPFPSTSVGLKNITDRYRILSEDLPVVEETNDSFSVILPLFNFNS